MDPNQLPALMSLLKGTGIGPGNPNARPPAPQPPTPNSAFMGTPQQFLPSMLGGSPPPMGAPQAPQPGSAFMGVPQAFLPQGVGGN